MESTLGYMVPILEMKFKGVGTHMNGHTSHLKCDEQKCFNVLCDTHQVKLILNSISQSWKQQSIIAYRQIKWLTDFKMCSQTVCTQGTFLFVSVLNALLQCNWEQFLPQKENKNKCNLL